jgi:TatD DNase family protein
MIAAQVAEGAINGGPEDLWTELRRLLESDPNAQVGEAGLDRRYAGYEPGGVQEKVFRKQAEMALELGRDLQIHCVGDYGRIIRVLREAGFAAGLKCARPDSSIKRPRPVFHRFGGDAGIVKAGLSLGALFSVHADTLRKKATREALALIPREHLLLETDADESFIETLVATRGSGDAITPQDVAVMLEDTLKEVSSRFSPAPQRG